MKNRVKLIAVCGALAVAALALPASASAGAAAPAGHATVTKSNYQENTYLVHMDTKCKKMDGLL